VTDSLPAIALGLDPCEPGIMNKKPYSKEKGLFSGKLWQRIIFEGCMIGMLALLAFAIGTVFFDEPGKQIIGGTMAFATLSISQLVHAFNMRSDGSIFSINPLGNLYLVGALIIGAILQAAVIIYAPLSKIFKVAALSPAAWLAVILLCLMPLVIVETEKALSEAGEYTRKKRNSVKRVTPKVKE
jgi:Ca2+-transporting ATPase